MAAISFARVIVEVAAYSKVIPCTPQIFSGRCTISIARTSPP